MQNIQIQKIDLVLFGKDAYKNVYNKYKDGRGISGLICVTEGESEYLFSNGTKMFLRQGEIGLFSEKSAYTVTNTSPIPFSHYAINFSTISESKWSEFFFTPYNFSAFSSKCELILQYWRSGEPSSKFRCMSVLYEVLADLIDCQYVNNFGKENYLTVLPAINYMDTHFNEHITIEFLAKYCAMSCTNFRRIFSTVCGVSPIEYLINVRVSRAKEYLLQNSLSVSEVAELCGFNDVEHFCRTIKKRTGLTASAIKNTAYLHE